MTSVFATRVLLCALDLKKWRKLYLNQQEKRTEILYIQSQAYLKK